MRGKKIITLLLALIFALTYSAGLALAADPTAGLVAQYKFDGDFKDSISGTDSTKVGNVIFADDGVFGKCALINRGYLISQNSSLLKLGANFTIAAWVKANPTHFDNGPDNRTIIAGFDGTIYNSYNAYLRSTFGMRFDAFVEGGEPTITTDNDYQLAEKWTHVAFSYDGTMLYLYVDGALQTTYPISDFGITTGVTVKEATKVIIGGNPSNGADYFNGRLDDLRVYNRALSDDEISALYNLALAQLTNKIVLTIDSNKMLVDDKEVPVDPASAYTTPIVQNERTLVPIRAIIENMGGRLGFDGNERRVDISLKGTDIKLWLDKTTADVNGKQVALQVPAQAINSRTMVPLRFVIENLGAQVVWDGATRSITILYAK